jgi:hypothetical protein
MPDQINLAKEYTNWRQIIKQIPDEKQLLVYKNDLLQQLQTQRVLLTNSSQSQTTSLPSKTETNYSKFVLLILGSLLGIIVLVGFWIRKRRV